MHRVGRSLLLFVLAAVALALSPRLALADNPFGVMLFPNPGEDFSLVLARARGLGVAWFRPPTVALGLVDPASPCRSCAVYLRSGLKLAVTVRNTDDPTLSAPSRPPANPASFAARIQSVLAAWRPALLVVESDENAPAFYQGNAEAYLAELETACELAHKTGALCANGGITGTAAAALAWLDLLGRGQADRACDFAKRALPGESSLCAYRKPAEVPAAIRERLLGDAGQLVTGYRTAPIDFVNFHWFGPDSLAFAETAEALGRLVGKPVMTNELGQRPGHADPAGVRPLLRAVVAEGVRVAIWYSVDTASSVSLFGRDGGLRPGGWEFQRQMAGLK